MTVSYTYHILSYIQPRNASRVFIQEKLKHVKYNDLHCNVHSSLTQNSPKLETIQMSITSTNVVNPYNEKEQTTEIYDDINHPPKVKEARHKRLL